MPLIVRTVSTAADVCLALEDLRADLDDALALLDAQPDAIGPDVAPSVVALAEGLGRILTAAANAGGPAASLPG
jgi:hypothetical protein